MSRKDVEWTDNTPYDGRKPVCPYCGTAYGDGDIFDIKNYPHDGIAAIFFPCDECGEEAELDMEWSKIEENKYRRSENE